MSKKIMTYLLILAIVLVQLGNSNVSAAELTDKGTLYSDEIKAEAGKTIDIPVYIKNNPGIMGAGISIKYDKDVFTPISVNAGKLMSSGVFNDSIETSKDDSFKVMWSSTDDMKEDGGLFIMTFSVSEFVRGHQTIQLSVDQEDTFNENWEDVELQTSEINVEVSDPVYNEANIKGKVEGSVDCGTKLSIPIMISNNSSVADADIAIEYDTNVFLDVTAESELADTCTIQKNSGGALVSLTGIKASDTEKTLFILNFNVADYTGGQYNFALKSEDIAATGFQVFVNNTHTDEKAIVYAGQVTYDKEGMISVPVCIKNNSGLMGYKFTVVYDQNVLKPETVSAGEKFTGNFDNNIGNKESSYDVLWSGVENVTGICTLFVAKFQVLSEESQKTKLTITYSQDDTFNEQYQDVVMDISEILINTTETVASAKPSTQPAVSPSADPTEKPVISPGTDPTEKPVVSPGTDPTEKPGVSPSIDPTEKPDVSPSADPTARPSIAPSNTPTNIPSSKPGDVSEKYVVVGEYTGWGGEESYPSSEGHAQGDGLNNYYDTELTNMVAANGYMCGLELMNPYNDVFTGASNEMSVFIKKMKNPVIRVTLKNGGEASSWNWHQELKFPSGQEVTLPANYLDGGYFSLFGNDDTITKVEIYDKKSAPTTEKPEETFKPGISPSPGASSSPGTSPSPDVSLQPDQPQTSAPGQQTSTPQSTNKPGNTDGNSSNSGEKKKAPSKPAKVKIKKASPLKRGKVKVAWKKVTGADWYIIQYSTKRSFSGSKVGIVYGKKTTLRLKKKKTYYIRILACKYGNSANNYRVVKGKWSKVKKVKTKA